MMAPILAIGTTTVTGTTCYNATQTITVAGSGNTFLVKNGGSATMIAGSKILYKAGTTVLNGGYMLGKITTNGTYCGAKSLEIVTAGPGEEQRNENPDSTVTRPDLEGPAGFRLYPNPTTGSFTLEFTGQDLPENLSAYICDLRGSKVLDINLNGQRKQVISLENQPKGMYFIRILSEKHSETSKILKQ
jgi:hypothetical protein